MNKIFSILLIVISAAIFGCAQKDPEPVSTWHKVIEIEYYIPDDAELISGGMYSGFHLITPYSPSVRKHRHYYSIYASTLDEKLPDSIPLIYNEKVEYYIELFQTRYKGRFNKWLRRSKYYMPQLKQMLAEEGVPTDLAYLPLIESGYNPKAVSRANAVGMWQFIQSTGQIYGLKINLWVDERRDYEKATIAASNYLKDLYQEFGSWELALAGYNCGEIRVRDGIQITNSYDYWIVSKTLPRETKNYVPKFIAAVIIAKNPKFYGFQEVNYDEKDKFVKVTVPPEKSLNDIAKVIGYEPQELRNHNPGLVSGITPPGSNYDIYIRPEYSEKFEENNDKIASLKSVKPNRTTYKTYRVKSGDNLWLIARKFGVSINSIKKTNKLRSNTLRPGQKLRIKKSKSSGKVYTAKKSSPSKSKYTKSASMYVVNSGDTIGEIAQKFGVKTSSLRNYNGLSSSKIKAGQKLKIPAGKRNSINYRIKSGDTLSGIAVKHKVSVNEIKKWNNLKTTKLTAGKKLKIYR
ncbi:MAG: LysM peptidoglycan-binding domain-containing protein [Thermodesulfobacteriota bacterium]